MVRIYTNCQSLKLQIIIPHTGKFIVPLCLFLSGFLQYNRCSLLNCYRTFNLSFPLVGKCIREFIRHSYHLPFSFSHSAPPEIGVYLYLGSNYTKAEENDACCCLKGIIQPELALWKTKWTSIINIHFQWFIKSSGKNPFIS